MLIAAHDRDLIGNACSKILSFEEKKIVSFDGKLDEYLSTVVKK